jgi:hypothetical protein
MVDGNYIFVMLSISVLVISFPSECRSMCDLIVPEVCIANVEA